MKSYKIIPVILLKQFVILCQKGVYLDTYINTVGVTKSFKI